MGRGARRDLGELKGAASVLRAWLPLASSWLLMAVELPALAAVVARLANPEVQLAAYGSVVLPLALIIEAPIIMLLAASTALCRDRASYRGLRSFMIRASAVLTALHLLVALTPAYGLVVEGLLGAPEAVATAARPGLILMTPWTGAIAYRRFNQGVLIRFGHGRAVVEGTLVRFMTLVTILGLGWVGPLANVIPGASLAAAAVASGVTSEAIYSGLRVRPVVRAELDHDDPEQTPLRGRAFANFYLPLAMTTVIALLAHPLTSAGLTRMPEVLASLATAPVVVGLLFILQSLGLALNEVVIAGLDRPGGERALWRFTLALAATAGVLVVLLAATPLSTLWLGRVSALDEELVELGRVALWLGVPIPVMRTLQAWYQGVLVHARETRAISEAVAVFLVAAGLVIAVGIATQAWPGIYVGLAAFSVGRVAQAGWMWWRSREQVARIRAR